MKWINYILQFLFIRIAKFEFNLHKDDYIDLEIYLTKTPEKINTVATCYGIIGFIGLFKGFNEDWTYIQTKFAIPFIFYKKKLIVKKIRKRNDLF